jgi:hypothetical protein
MFANATRPTIPNQQGYCNPCPFPSSFSRIYPWISLMDYPLPMAEPLSLWLSISFPNMGTLLTLSTPIQQHKWRRLFLRKSSVSMAFLPQLFVTGIRFLRGFSGGSSSAFMGLSSTLVLPIIYKQTDKRKW